MPGFFISNRHDLRIGEDPLRSRCVGGVIPHERYRIERKTLNKYLDDKLFYENDELIIITEGILLNKSELMQSRGAKDTLGLVLQMRAEDPLTFYRHFRGSFSGAILDKETEEWLVFTDHTGSRAVFYYWDETTLLIASQLKDVTDAMRQLGIPRQAEASFFGYMATYGFALDERTCVRHVYRLFPGHYLRTGEGKQSIHEYYRLDNTPDIEVTDEQAIEQMDALFRRAIKRVVEKDREYGYQTIMDISGGMDSRTIAYVANTMGYTSIPMTSFAQTGSNDQRVGEMIARDLHSEYLFWALDGATHLYDIDQIMTMNSGSCYYAGIGGMKRLLDRMDSAAIGISLNGIFGDVYEGGHLYVTVDGGYKKYPVNDLANGKSFSRLVSVQLDERCMDRYDNAEQFLYTTRDMFGNQNTGLTKQHYIETVSPFGDIEFLERFYSLPREMRITRRICLRWLQQKYPRALAFPYAATGQKPLAHPVLLSLGDYARRGLGRTRRLLKLTNKGRSQMNPADYWYRTNPQFREFIAKYVECHSHLMEDELSIVPMVNKLVQEGSTLEKLQGLGLLALFKLYLAD